MKKMVLVAAVLAMTPGSSFAADMAVKPVKAPPPAPFDPWDLAFGSAIMNDYVFRGVTQSAHKPSVAAYFEPRYNINKDVQLYIGTSFESISFPGSPCIRADSASVRWVPCRRAIAQRSARAPISARTSHLVCLSTATSPRRTPVSLKATPRLTTPSPTTGNSA